MKKDRTIEIQYYDWRLMAWLSSETRDRLDATGRGIYRELLDHCYAQGSFPDDPEWMRRKCAASQKQMADVWPIIEKHFPLNKEKTHRENVLARIFRKKTLQYLEGQKKRSKLAADKYRNKNNLEGVASGYPEASPAQRNGTEGNGTEGNGTNEKSGRVRAMPRPTADDLNRPMSGRFDEWFSVWAGVRGNAHRAHAAQAHQSTVSVALESDALECARSYVTDGPGSDPAHGYRPDNFLFEMARDGFRTRWQARASPAPKLSASALALQFAREEEAKKNAGTR